MRINGAECLERQFYKSNYGLVPAVMQDLVRCMSAPVLFSIFLFFPPHNNRETEPAELVKQSSATRF